MSIGDVKSEARGSGARYNDGKPALDLIPLMAMEECARVFDYGRKKYAEWNWAKGMDWSIPYACMLRHLSAWHRGEDNDPESGLPHLGHVMCNLVMLSTYAKTYPEGDNRPSKWFKEAINNKEVTEYHAREPYPGDPEPRLKWTAEHQARFDAIRDDVHTVVERGVPNVQTNLQPKNCS